jgi:hypothetical protein
MNEQVSRYDNKHQAVDEDQKVEGTVHPGTRSKSWRCGWGIIETRESSKY